MTSDDEREVIAEVPLRNLTAEHERAMKAEQRATAAEAEVERLKEAYRHYQAVKQQGKSGFIKETGRFGGSPWAELCDAIEQLINPKG